MLKKKENQIMPHILHMQDLAKSGKLPRDVYGAALTFGTITANSPTGDSELMFDYIKDLNKKHNIEWGSDEFVKGMSKGGVLRTGLHEANKDPKTFPSSKQWQDPKFRDPHILKHPHPDGRQPGDKKKLGFVDTFADALSKHSTAFVDRFHELGQKHKGNGQTFMQEYLDESKGLIRDPSHPAFTEGRGGIKTKTGSLSLAMAGYSNIFANDIHMTSDLHGLDITHKGDKLLRGYMQELINEPNNYKAQTEYFKAYADNHPAVERAHQKWYGGEGDKSNAIFAAMWPHWAAISHHQREQKIGKPSQMKNAHNIHAPVFEEFNRILDFHGIPGLNLDKAEEDNSDIPLHVRAAFALKSMVDKVGEVPALGIYYTRIMPHLLDEAKVREGVEKYSLNRPLDKSEKNFHPATEAHGLSQLHPENETIPSPGPDGWKPRRLDMTRRDTKVMVPVSMIRDRSLLVDTPERNEDPESWGKLPEHMEELEGSIKESGIKDKLMVGLHPGGKIELLDGTHRAYIAEKLGIQFVPADVQYYAHAEKDGLLHEEKAMEKSMKNLAMAGAMAATSLIPSNISTEKPMPTKVPDPPAIQAQAKRVEAKQQSEVYDDIGTHKHDNFLNSISQIESSGGKNTNHETITSGQHTGHKAIGSYGLMPNTVKYVAGIASHDNVKALKDLTPEQITETLGKDKVLTHEVAREYVSRMDTRFDGNLSRMAFSWFNGHNSKATDQEVKDHWYTKKFHGYHNKLKKAEEVEKKSFLPHSDKDFERFMDRGDADIAFDKERPLTPERISRGLKHDTPYVARFAISHPDVTKENISEALNHDDIDIRLTAIRHPKATDDHLQRAINDSGQKELGMLVAKEALANPNLKKEHLDSIFHNPENDYDAASTEHIHKLYLGTDNRPNPEKVTKLMATALEHPNLTEDHIHAAEKYHHDVAVHSGLASYPLPTALDTARDLHLPDEMHDENITVSHGSEVYRGYRTAVEGKEGTIHKKDFKEHDINEQHVSKLLDAKGHLTQKALDDHIDSLPSTKFNISHDEHEAGVGPDEDARDEVTSELHDQYLLEHKEAAELDFEEYKDSVREDNEYDYKNEYLPEFTAEMKSSYADDWKELNDKHKKEGYDGEVSDDEWHEHLSENHSEEPQDLEDWISEERGEPDFDSYYEDVVDPPQDVSEWYGDNSDDVEERLGAQGDEGAPNPGVQTHSAEDQNVLQVNITNDHVQQMKDAGIYGTFNNVIKTSKHSGHPAESGTIGWVRSTEGSDGHHIDEIQSDFASDLETTLRRQIKAAKEAGTLDDAGAADALKKGKDKYPTEHLQQIRKILFGSGKAETMLHEAFHQYHREHNSEEIGKKIHMNSADIKSKLAGMSDDRQKPAWMQRIYEQTPKKLGYKESEYGELDTQDNDYHSGSRTWGSKLHRTELQKTEDLADFTHIMEQVQNKDGFVKEDSQIRAAIQQTWPLNIPLIFEAARFMGEADEAGFDQIKRSLYLYDEADEAALHCYGIPITEKNREHLHSVCSVLCGQPEKPILEKFEDLGMLEGIPKCGEDLVEAVNRGLANGKATAFSRPVAPNEKAMLIVDFETDLNFILKPDTHSITSGSSLSSPIKEMGFYKVARILGLDKYVMNVGLARDAKQEEILVMQMLPRNYTILEEKRRIDPNCDRPILEQYLRDGMIFKWAVLDYVAGNPDRHSFNMMVNVEGDVIFVDHSSSMVIDFDPSGEDTYIPYYLRAWGVKARMSDKDKMRHMPTLHPEVGEEVREWVMEKNPQWLYDSIAIISADAAQAASDRLKHIQKLMAECEDPIDTINRLWVGSNL